MESYAQTAQLTAALKQVLRSRGLRYKDLADMLDVSLATIKRCFAEESFTLRRLENICDGLDLSFFELMKIAYDEDDTKQKVLTVEQEQGLAQDPRVMLTFYMLQSGWTADEIREEYELEEVVIIDMLTTLDRLRVIDLMPGNRVRMLTARVIDWRQGGAVRQLFDTYVKEEFLRANFAEVGAVWGFETAEISKASQALIETKIEHLLRDFRALAEADHQLPREHKEWVGFLAAIRHLPLSELVRDQIFLQDKDPLKAGESDR